MSSKKLWKVFRINNHTPTIKYKGRRKYKILQIGLGLYKVKMSSINIFWTDAYEVSSLRRIIESFLADLPTHLRFDLFPLLLLLLKLLLILLPVDMLLLNHLILLLLLLLLLQVYLLLLLLLSEFDLLLLLLLLLLEE